MPTLPDPTTLSLDERTDLLVAQMADKYPDLDITKTSTIGTLLLSPGAYLTEAVTAEVEGMRAAMSGDIENADSETVDLIASSFGLTRKAGAKATGEILVKFTSNVTRRVTTATEFTVGALVFMPTNNHVLTVAPAATTDRELVAQTNGQYAATIPVTAVEPGVAGNIRAGEILSWETAPDGYISSSAYSTFTGGEDEESDEALLARRKPAMTAPVFAGRQNIRALLTALYPELVDSAVFGSGDAETVRAGHNAFGVKVGSYADVYARTAKRLTTSVLAIEGTVTDLGTKTVTIGIPKTALPGFYAVTTVTRADRVVEGSLPVQSIVYAVDTAGEKHPIPSTSLAYEHGFSAYRTATVFITDAELPSTAVNGSQFTYNVTIVGLPDLGMLTRALLDDTEISPFMVDASVRAPFPVFLDLEMSVLTRDATLTASQVVDMVQARVEQILFADTTINAADLVAAVQSATGDQTAVQLPVTLRARLLLPDGTSVSKTSSNSISFDEPNAYGYSRRNVTVYLNMCTVTLVQE